MAIGQGPDSSDWVQRLNKLYVDIVALEFGEDPATLSSQVYKSSKIEDWMKEYEKVRALRPEISVDKKTKQFKVTGLTGLK